MRKDDIADTIASRLSCAEPANEHRMTPAQVEAMERGGFHVLADPAEALEGGGLGNAVEARAHAWAKGVPFNPKAKWDQPLTHSEHREASGGVHAPLPTKAEDRKGVPLYSGLMQYFPDALVAVAQLSKVGNDQHNPGQPLHWSRGKSNDHHDCLARHLLEAGTIDTDKVRHSTKVAWRALAALQLELEAAREGGQ